MATTSTHGFIRLIRSSKAYAALGGTVFAAIPFIFSWSGGTREQHQAATNDFAHTVWVLWGGVIVMTGIEDSRRPKSGDAAPDVTDDVVVPAVKKPMQIQLPSVVKLILLCLLPLAAAGCQSTPVEYSTFRESYVNLADQINAQHQRLMADAVKNKLRTPADQRWLAGEIDTLDRLADASRRNTPTTQP